eukprot:TRINITY_DN11053_c0_g1_i1.p1 TRINITY_DN11053_c0_g1~~TRINITY_DN11053_c0_g1_i1.p1  ORF type:complete len:392 (+),score=70.57 TRINITY_DN11053_c0_g1_i1:63-1238(+)
MNRLDVIFDPQRIGLNEIAECILSYLDYGSLVNLKRTCWTVYSFISNSDFERIKEVRRLTFEWKLRSPEQIVRDVHGLVSCARFFDEGRKVVLGIDHHIQVFHTSQKSIQKEPLLSISNENSIVKCVDVNPDGTIIASGSADGLLILWDIHSGEQLLQRQAFGRIEAIRWKGPFFVTAHFGKAFDAGCISLREYRSPKDFSVIHSIYEDLFPIFCLDFNETFLSALEWSGTYNNVHGGNVNIYRLKNLKPVANLSMTASRGYTYTNCRFFGNFLLTTGHDGCISIWEMPLDDESDPLLLRSFKGHEGIIVRMEVDSFLQRIVTRDINGQISVWDLSKYCDEDAPLIDNEDLLLRKIDSMSRTITCLSLEKRRLLLGSIGAFNIQDFWSSSF